jgi:hypothetical protein
MAGGRGRFVAVLAALAFLVAAPSGAAAPPSRWIVEFDAPCAAETLSEKDYSRQAAREALEPLFKQLEGDLEILGRSAVRKPAPVILRRYRDCLAGAAIRAVPSTARELVARSYVAAVYPDVVVSADVNHARELMGVDAMVQVYNVRGEGMRVAIIDTGIDYTHPNLGAGYGPGARVVGGYDFVNDDDDPMDDGGHGTAVAGVVASDHDVLFGVAPRAQLLALKVLNAQGGGWSSDVAAGLEFAVDPDGDAATDDGAHVANLSLSAPDGHPDDFLCRAVDGAVALGMVVCASAGNRGQVQGAVGTPSAAKQAITVGSISAYRLLSQFSSWGPTLNVYDVKPDLLAVGEGVKTLALGGGIGSAVSGTSFSSPFVAGAAALLLQLHPDWTPQQVKAALVNSTDEVGWQPSAQGSGLMNLLRAAQGEFIAEPAVLSLGIDDLDAPIWDVRRSIKLRNISDQALALTLSIDRAFMVEGVDATVSPRKIDLAAGQGATAAFELRVDNGVAPITASLPRTYSGYVSIQGGSTAARVPFSVVVHPEIRLTFQYAPWMYDLALAHQAGPLWEYQAYEPLFARLMRAGRYDLGAVVQRPGPAPTDVLLFADLTHSTMTDLRVGAEHLPHCYAVEAIEPGGEEEMPLTDAIVRLSHGQEIRIDATVPLANGFRLSPLFAASKFEWRMDWFGAVIVQLNGLVDQSLQGDHVERIGPDDYRRLNVEFVDEKENPAALARILATAIDTETGDLVQRYAVRSERLLPSRETLPFFYTPASPAQDFRYTQYHFFWTSPDEPFLVSSLIDMATDPPTRRAPGSGARAIRSVDDGRLWLGRGPFVYSGGLYNYTSREALHHWAGVDTHDVLFAGPDGDYYPQRVAVRRLAGDDLSIVEVNTGWTNGRNREGHVSLISHFRYRLEFTFEDPDWPSYATAEFYGNTADPDPPYLRRLEVFGRGRDRRNLSRQWPNALMVDLADRAGEVRDVSVTLYATDSTDLVPLIHDQQPDPPIPGQALTVVGGPEVYWADIPTPAPGLDGPFSVFLSARDESGNVLRVLALGAFEFGAETGARGWSEYD